MTTRIHANNFATTINGAISNSATSIILTSVTGFPSIGAGVTCNLTLQHGSTIEIVTATARSSNTLTVTRGAEGTSGVAWADLSSISIRPTADSVDRKIDTAGGATSRKILVSNGTSWGASTETYAVPGTSGNVLQSDGTNWTSAAAIALTALTGDVTASGPGSAAATIAAGAVSLSKMANLAANSFLGNNTGSGATPIALTYTQTKTALSLNLVENTALSTWAGTTGITTLGTVTAGVWNATAITVTYGGSGRASATAYAPIVGGTTSTGAHQSSASGSTGQIYQSAGNAAVPTWSTPTYPSTSPTSGKILQSDGTNIIASTATWPTAATTSKFLLGNGTNYVESTSTIPTSAGSTANKLLLSDGTNYILSTPTFPNASATSGKRIKSDGTNWVASTTTMPDTGTTGKVLIGDGTNYVESTSTIPTSAGVTALKHLKSDGTNYVLTTATISDTPSTAGKMLVSDGTNWITSTPTFPNASATTRKIIVSDGTNWTASTETYAVPSTSGKIMQSDGTNWTSATPTGTGTPVLATSPTLITPVLGVAAATSINFGVDALNAYTKRTAWTPVFTFVTPGDLVISAVSGSNWYVRVGDMVLLFMAYTFTPTFTTASGNASVTGLPVASVAGQNNASGQLFNSSGLTYPASCTLLLSRIAGNASIMSMVGVGSNTNTPLSTTNFTSGVSTTLSTLTYYFAA